MGVVLAARAGYDPFGPPEVLQNIGRAAKNEGAVALLFKTHPLPDARLKQLGLAMADRFDATNGRVLAGRLYKLKPQVKRCDRASNSDQDLDGTRAAILRNLTLTFIPTSRGHGPCE